MQLARLYIPKYPNAPVTKLEARLAEAFNGYTMYSFAVGAWRGPSGALCTEPVYVYDVVLQGHEDSAALEQILLQYKETADQEAVLYILNNTPIFL